MHGYTTADDLEAAVRSLHPGASGRLLDLGCGLGGIALEVNRRTGAFVTGASQTESPVPITSTVPTSHALSSEGPTPAIAAPAVTATTRPPAM